MDWPLLSLALNIIEAEKTAKHYMIKIWFEYIVFMGPDSLAKVIALTYVNMFQC